MKLRPLFALLVVQGLCTTQAGAYDFGDYLRVEGFGTLGAFKANDPVATVRADPRQKNGSLGYHTRYDADTLLAAQATINPMGPIKGVVQVVSKQDYQGSQKPQVEWAYVGWDVNSSLNVKAGRVVAPVFMTSETRNVAFAQTMARPLNTVYQINPITNVDGANFKWNTRINDDDFGIEGMAGSSSVSNSLGVFEAKNMWGLGAKYATGPWTVRAGVTNLKIDIKSQTIATQIAALSGSAACSNCSTVIPNRFGMSDVDMGLQTIGVSFDNDDYIAQAEFASRSSSSALAAKAEGWYIMAGKRINNWTPYFMLGQFKFVEDDLGLQPAAAPATATIKFYNDSMAGLGKGNRVQMGAGVRWDFAPKFALKAQWDQYDIQLPSIGKNVVVDYAIPSTTFDGRVHSLTLNLDFVF